MRESQRRRQPNAATSGSSSPARMAFSTATPSGIGSPVSKSTMGVPVSGATMYGRV